MDEFSHPFHDPGHPRHREFITRYSQLGCISDIAPDEDRPERVRRPPTLAQLIARMERETPPEPAPEPEPEIAFTRTRRA